MRNLNAAVEPRCPLPRGGAAGAGFGRGSARHCLRACWRIVPPRLEIFSLLGSQITLFYPAGTFARKAGKLIALCSLLIGLGMIALQGRCAEPETVGMEAKGIDVWTAWRHAATLDVRDSLNRPVSVRRIQQQIHGAEKKAGNDADGLSHLPYARKILRILDELPGLGAAICAIRFTFPWSQVEALPWILRSTQRLGAFAILVPFVLCRSRPLPGGRLGSTRLTGAELFLPLRC